MSMGLKGTLKQRLKKEKEVKDNREFNVYLRNRFPGCIGKFPECSTYNENMSIDERTECKLCPFKQVINVRIYSNYKEAISEIQRDLYEMGIEVKPYSYQNKIVDGNDDFTTKELQYYQFMVINHDDIDDIINNVTWCRAEFTERIFQYNVSSNPLNPGNAWRLREDVWRQFLVRGKFDYTYNERMKYQIRHIIHELQIHPNTRQAIIEIHNNKLDITSLGGKKRIPCSMFYQFMIRNGKLDIFYVMRSSDFFTHFRNDIWLANRLQKFISDEIKVPIGRFTMVVASLHAYKKDFPRGVY